MIRLPRTLQQIYTFEKDGVWYITNLQTGDVLQIDALTADILALCSTNDNLSIVEKLEGKYSEAQILESLKTLSGDIEMLLFEPEQDLILTEKEKLRIFIPHGFMKYKEILSPSTNVGIYNLLIALSKYAEVFLECESTSIAVEQREQLTAFGIQFVSDMFESTHPPTYASNRFVIDNCDGILALSPHPYEELNYFRHNSIPIVSRVYSDRNLREATINKVLSHHALRRKFDRLCPDTPWIAAELALLKCAQTISLPYNTSRFKGLQTISNGVDPEDFSPKSPQQAREVVASIVGEKGILDVPFVGILNGLQPHNSIGMITELARLHKNVVFIVLDQMLALNRTYQPRNIFYINLQRPEDIVVLPWVYNACEFIIFPTVIGTPFSMVLEAFACGVPGLALNLMQLPEKLGDCMISVPLTQDNTTGKFIIPTAALSEQIGKLLGTPKMRETMSIKARQIALDYSWERTAQHFVSLFTELREKRMENRTQNHSHVAFSPYYNKTQNVVKTGAMKLDGLFKERVEEGLAQTLSSDHTLEEIRMVLQHMLQDSDKVDSLLSTLNS